MSDNVKSGYVITLFITIYIIIFIQKTEKFILFTFDTSLYYSLYRYNDDILLL